MYTPQGYEVEGYAIRIVNQDKEILWNETVSATSSSYLYESEQSRSEYPECSRLVFSVAVITSNGAISQSEDVVWEQTRGEWIYLEYSGTSE